MNLKTFLVVLIFCINVNLFASEQYKMVFDLLDNDKKIGTMESSCIETQGGSLKYINSIKIKTSFLFFDYFYTYKEEALVTNSKLIQLKIYEDDNGQIKEIIPLIENKMITYENGKRLMFEEIDYFPFNLNLKKQKKSFHKEEFSLQTFDPLNGDIIIEDFYHLGSDQKYKFNVKSKEGNEIRVYNKNIKLIYMKNELFESRLLKDSK